MKRTLSILSAITILAFAAAPASALPQSSNCSLSDENNVEVSCSDFFSTTIMTFFATSNTGFGEYGCMGDDNDSPKTYVMTFPPPQQPLYHYQEGCENDTPSRDTSSVPDGGSSVAMLGAAFVGFVLVRRRKSGPPPSV